MAVKERGLGRYYVNFSSAVLRKIFVTDCRKRVLTKFYRAVSNFIIDALIIAVLFALLAGTLQIFIRLPVAFSKDFFSHVFHRLLNDVMVIFIFVELFRVLLGYFKEERVKITYIADATLVFTFKEIWVRFSDQSFEPIKILAMGAAMLVVVIVRTLAVLFSPDRARE